MQLNNSYLDDIHLSKLDPIVDTRSSSGMQVGEKVGGVVYAVERSSLDDLTLMINNTDVVMGTGNV